MASDASGFTIGAWHAIFGAFLAPQPAGPAARLAALVNHDGATAYNSAKTSSTLRIAAAVLATRKLTVQAPGLPAIYKFIPAIPPRVRALGEG